VNVDARSLRRLIGDNVLIDHPVATLTTYRVGGRAAVFVRVDEEEQLSRVAEAAGTLSLPVLVIGRGSNMLVSDRVSPASSSNWGTSPRTSTCESTMRRWRPVRRFPFRFWPDAPRLPV